MEGLYDDISQLIALLDQPTVSDIKGKPPPLFISSSSTVPSFHFSFKSCKSLCQVVCCYISVLIFLLSINVFNTS